MSQAQIHTMISPIPGSLPVGPRPSLPPEAANEYRLILSELNRWCRDHDSSARFNSWVAEQAIREVWE